MSDEKERLMRFGEVGGCTDRQRLYGTRDFPMNCM